MSEDKKTPKERKPLRLQLNTVPTQVGESSVRQNLSHGRSKTVTVEVKKKRVQLKSPSRSDVSSRLTDQEQTLRRQALEQSKERSFDERRFLMHVDQEVSPEKPPVKEEEVPEPLFVAPPEPLFQSTRSNRSSKSQETQAENSHFTDTEDTKKRSPKNVPQKKRARNPSANEESMPVEEEVQQGPILGLKRLRRHKSSRGKNEKLYREVSLPDDISVQELAHRCAEKVRTLVRTLAQLGVTATPDQLLDAQTAELVLQELGHKVVLKKEENPEEALWEERDEANEKSRAPVVAIMGHVDHGKTTLLDALRKTNVAAGEAGGITQHIGAYQITMPSGKRITFIDTPGHAAFQEMRARGATVTDIIVLVVAADSTVNAQTVEAIQHARSGNVPLVVAINKMDKQNADANAVRQQLLAHEVVVESMGGETLDVEISALKGTHLDKLEEAILLQAELLGLKASPKLPARGTILETHVRKGIGAVGTVLVQRGTLRKGDVFVCGNSWGRVRLLFDDGRRPITDAGPSVPVEVSGFQVRPQPGDRFLTVQSEAAAKDILSWKEAHTKQVQEQEAREYSLADTLRGAQLKELSLIIKADVYGSLEGICHELSKIVHEEIAVKVIHKEIGTINESDVLLAKASHATILGFNVSILPQAKKLAQLEGVTILMHTIIYHAIDELKSVLSRFLEPEIRKDELGYAEVIQIFSSKNEMIAGCSVKKGVLRRGEIIQVVRDKKIVFEGPIKSIRHLKDDVKEIKSGYECGIMADGFDDFQVGDTVKCFHLESVARVIA